MQVRLANPVLVFISSIALLLFGCAIGIHWRKTPSVAVWIAVCGALLMVVHDLLAALVWFGITAAWNQMIRNRKAGHSRSDH